MQAITPVLSRGKFHGLDNGEAWQLEAGLNAGSAQDELRDKMLRSLLAQEQVETFQKWACRSQNGSLAVCSKWNWLGGDVDASKR